MLYLVYSNTWCRDAQKKVTPPQYTPGYKDSKATGIGYQPSLSPRPLPWNVLAPQGDEIRSFWKMGSLWNCELWTDGHGIKIRFNSLSKFFCAKPFLEQLIGTSLSSLKVAAFVSPSALAKPRTPKRLHCSLSHQLPGGDLRWKSWGKP